jgi:hypothetical protein
MATANGADWCWSGHEERAFLGPPLWNCRTAKLTKGTVNRGHNNSNCAIRVSARHGAGRFSSTSTADQSPLTLAQLPLFWRPCWRYRAFPPAGPARFRAAVMAFPQLWRGGSVGRVPGMGGWVILHASLGRFDFLKPYVYAAGPCVFLVIKFMDELLAPRAWAVC